MWISWCMSIVQLCIKSNKVAAACRCASSSWAFLDVIWYVIIGRFCGMQQPKVGNTAEVCLGVLAIKWSQTYEITPNNQQFISQTMSALLLVLFFEFVKASLWQLQTDGEITHFTCQNNWFAEWKKKPNCVVLFRRRNWICVQGKIKTHTKKNPSRKCFLCDGRVLEVLCWLTWLCRSSSWALETLGCACLGSAEPSGEPRWPLPPFQLSNTQLAAPKHVLDTDNSLSCCVYSPCSYEVHFIYECVVSTLCCLAPLPVKMQITLKSLGSLFIFL